MRLLALLTSGLLVASISADDKKTKDEDALQGVWAFDTLDTGSKGGPEKRGELSKLRFHFKKDQAAVQFDDEEVKFYAFKLDPSADPKTLDINPDDKKMAMKMLYTLDGDTLKVCLKNGPDGAARPAEFKAESNNSIGVITLKRVKDEKKDK